MRPLWPIVLCACLLAAPLAAEPDEPPAGPDIAVDWAKFRDLEALFGRLETEAFALDKKRLIPVAPHSWGKHLPVVPPEDLAFPVEKPDKDSEVAFLRSYLEHYTQAIRTARSSAQDVALAAGVIQEAEPDYATFAQRLAARFKLPALERAAQEPEDIRAKKEVTAEILRFAERLPEWEGEFKRLIGIPDAEYEREWERRLKEARKLAKRFDIGKDLGTSELSGASVIDIKLGPVGIEWVKNGVNSLKTWAVVDADGRRWRVNGQPLLVCSLKSLPDINSHVKDIKNEYVVFRYRQIGYGDMATKDIIRLVAARLYLGTRYFLFYKDRVILFTEDRPGK